MRSVDFIRGASCPPPPSSPCPPAPPQPRAADSSGHCWTSTASSRALPDVRRELQSSVCTAGLQPRGPELTGHCRTFATSSRAQWALPDLNRELQISVGTAGRSPWAPSVGTAGPQAGGPELSGHCRTFSQTPQRMSNRMPDRMLA